jgi:O-antigen/teichoic acid export membrane protein
MTKTENNKRIAKNTMFLYFRMMLTMVVSLYTVRVILSTLGVVDYGLYNVVGGIVTMFSFLSSSMASASQRFFSFDLGKNDMGQLKRTFSMTIFVYIIISVAILILAETIGLWFLNTKMVIPAERMIAANWIYQFSILSFLVTMFAIPYNSVILARENMAVYAYISIVEVILKLGMVFFLLLFSIDKLKLYAVLIFVTSCIVSFIYIVVCKRKYKETQFEFYWDKDLFKSMFSYSSWMLMGTMTTLLSNQGLNILINIFFGPAINAARAIAYQVNFAVVSFSNNFYTSIRPQIVKSYAAADNSYMITLAIQSSKFSFYLLLLVAMPILFETKFLLDLWLKDTTESMVVFTRLIVLFSIVMSLENPLSAMVQATGNLKRYELLIGSFTLLSLPISFILFKLGFAAESSIYVLIVTNIFVLFLRLWVIRDLVGMSIKRYSRDVLLIISAVTIIAMTPPIILRYYLEENTISRFLIVSISCVISVLFSLFYIGLNTEERKFLVDKLPLKNKVNICK